MDSEATGGWATWLSAHPLVHQRFGLQCVAILLLVVNFAQHVQHVLLCCYGRRGP